MPIVGPLIGGVVGAAIYKVFITPYLTGEEPQEPGRVPSPEGETK